MEQKEECPLLAAHQEDSRLSGQLAKEPPNLESGNVVTIASLCLQCGEGLIDEDSRLIGESNVGLPD